MKFSPSAPTAAAGTVASTTSQARRSSALNAPVADGAEPGDDEPGDVSSEVGRDRHERADVQADVEGRVEGVVLLQIRPVREPGHEDQVAGRRDGQEFGQALNDTEHERLPARQLPRLFADPQRREHDGQQHRCPGQNVDAAMRARMAADQSRPELVSIR